MQKIKENFNINKKELKIKIQTVIQWKKEYIYVYRYDWKKTQFKMIIVNSLLKVFLISQRLYKIINNGL